MPDLVDLKNESNHEVVVNLPGVTEQTSIMPRASIARSRSGGAAVRRWRQRVTGSLRFQPGETKRGLPAYYCRVPEIKRHRDIVRVCTYPLAEALGKAKSELDAAKQKAKLAEEQLAAAVKAEADARKAVDHAKDRASIESAAQVHRGRLAAVHPLQRLAGHCKRDCGVAQEHYDRLETMGAVAALSAAKTATPARAPAAPAKKGGK